MESSILRLTRAVQTTSVVSTPQNVSGLAVGQGSHSRIFVDLRLCGDRSACQVLTPSAPDTTVLTSSKLRFWHALEGEVKEEKTFRQGSWTVNCKLTTEKVWFLFPEGRSSEIAKHAAECTRPCMYRPEVSKCHVALKQRKALNFAVTHTRIQQSRCRSLHAMQQIYAAICLISTRKEWLHCQIQVQIPILSFLHHLPHFALPGRFGQSLNLLNRDSMACRTPVRKAQIDGRRRAWQGILSSLPQASFVLEYFLLNSTENFKVVASRPRKTKPHSLGCFLVTDFMKTGQSSASGRSPVRLWNARPRFFLTWTFPLPFLPDLYTHLTYSLFFYFSYMERVFCIIHCNFVYFSPLGDPRPGFSPRWLGIH